MQRIRDEIVAKLFGRDPWEGVLGGNPQPIQGWNSNHQWLTDLILEHRPKVVVEIGVWKGGSVAKMAQAMARMAHDGVVIAVDTWLGSSEHWLDPRHRDSLDTLYGEFATNIASYDLTNWVLPLRLDSLNAARLFYSRGIRVDAIHLDGGHDHHSVTADLQAWWPLLADGGIFLGDDYYRNGEWPEVKHAIDGFILGRVAQLESWDGKCRAMKIAT